MRRYTTSDFNRTRAYNSAIMDRRMRRNLNEAMRIIDEDDISERELNELFGWGDNVEKPSKPLSLENSDEDNAELFIQWCGYFMSKAGNNVEKGLTKLFSEFGSVIIKMPKMIVKGVIMLLSGAIKASIGGIQTICAVFLGSIFGLIRLINSGVESAKSALSYLNSRYDGSC